MDNIRTDIPNIENEENNLLAGREKQLQVVGNNTVYTITIGTRFVGNCSVYFCN